MNRFFGHLHIITKHRNTVMLLCFKAGLIWRGIRHDWSKYSPTEFFPGVKYYQGDKSPQVKEREYLGYSAAWLHHKGRNKHHYEYWTEASGVHGERKFVDMPCVYFVEMVCDRIAASKIYLKDKYTDSSPLAYFKERTDIGGMSEYNAKRLEYFLTLLAEKGETETFRQLKKYVKYGKTKEKAEKKSLKQLVKADRKNKGH